MHFDSDGYTDHQPDGHASTGHIAVACTSAHAAAYADAHGIAYCHPAPDGTAHAYPGSDFNAHAVRHANRDTDSNAYPYGDPHTCGLAGCRSHLPRRVLGACSCRRHIGQSSHCRDSG